MSLARVRGLLLDGMAGLVVEVEAYLSQGLPGMTVVGLADTAVGEARDRVRAATVNSALPWPGERRITVGLSPAAVHKRGSALDLAIALAIQTAQGQVPEVLATAAIGELGLDGAVRPVRGVLVAALAARKAGLDRVLVPIEQVAEAQLVPDLQVVGVSRLPDAVAILRGEPVAAAAALPAVIGQPKAIEQIADMSDVRGQPLARAALEIAAAGGHHLAMIGEPGIGKTMLAERLPGLLPELDDELAVEVTALHSLAAPPGSVLRLIRRPPFQAPHHTATVAALVGGGGTAPRLGMATLAHGGVLCLDEAPEFDRVALDALRQPLESGWVSIARAGFTAQLPARFQLVLAANPCPCGKFVGTGRDCSCAPIARRRYLARLSGPLLDRIDLRLELVRPTLADLDGPEPEGTAAVAHRVLLARERAAARLAHTPWRLNAQVPGPVLRRRFPADPTAQRMLMRDLGRLSARGVDRVLRVAWTLADLANQDRPGIDEISSALRFRDSAWQEAA